MIPEHVNALQSHVEFEHAFRDKLRQYSVYIRTQILGDNNEDLRITYRFEHGTYNCDAGTWFINTWGYGTPDITTKGAVFAEVVQSHIRRVSEQIGLDKLPALLPAPEPQRSASMMTSEEIARQEIGTYEE